ncbi:hexapeptide transferase [Pelobium manganitolerans]|uniref:Hexapeptide transferase n=1 Tax=Pelobium manganitolerans TaxID=1842495 RepID=A0A419SC28_9SPHI|nr:acyltransferase [Pelobium manganitolerans]RKD20359.1 hexapeptide transferase [Pelobium manganitolerans]
MQQPKYFVHSSSVIDENVEIGEGTAIWHFCHISAGARIGKNCNIGQNVFIGKNVNIGDGVKIQNNVSVYEGVVVEQDVFIGPSVVFTNVLTPRAFINRKGNYQQTLLKKGVSIGANATIVCGTTIGNYALVGAGSVLTKNVGDFELWYGNPATKQGQVDEEGNVV